MRCRPIVLIVLAFLLAQCQAKDNEPHPVIENSKAGPGPLVLRIEELLEPVYDEKNRQQYLDAEKLLKEALKTDSQNDRIFLALGRIYALGLGIPVERGQEATFRSKEMYERAIQINPDNKQAYLHLAALLSMNTLPEDQERACGIYGKALELDPGDVEVSISLWRCLMDMNRTQEAKEVLAKAEKVLDKAGKRDDWVNLEYVEIAGCHYENRNYTKAVDLLLEVVESARRSENSRHVTVVAQETLGRAYAALGKFDLARQVFKKSADLLDEENAEHNYYWGCLYRAMGIMYSEMKKLDDACKAYRNSADREFDNSMTHFEAALACFYSGDHDDAMNYVNKALAILDNDRFEGDDGKYKEVKGLIYLFMQKFEEAEAMFNEAENRCNGCLGVMVGQGHISIVKKDYAAAARQLEAAIAPPPGRQTTWNANAPGILDEYELILKDLARLGLGWIAANQNMHEKAIGRFDEILERNPESIPALLGKGNALGHLKKFKQAQVQIKKALDIQPGNKHALAELALIHFNKGEDKAAEKVFKEAIAQGDPNYTCPYEGLGLLYLRQGKVEQAKEYLKKAIDINPDIEFKKFNALANIYIREGRLGKASKLLKKSMENNPHDPEAKKLLQQFETGQAK